MYYEEKMINGVMHWRSSPQDEFTAYTIEHLSARYESLKQKNIELLDSALLRAARGES